MSNRAISIVSGAAFILAASGAAFAADMAVKAPPPAPAPLPTWTGFYGGIQFGGGWSDEAVNYSPNDPAAAGLLSGTIGFPGQQPVATGYRIPQSGAVSGVEAGYNWQWSSWLLGVEADFSAAGMSGRASGTSFVQFTAPRRVFSRNRPLRSRAPTGTERFVDALAGSQRQTCCCSVPAVLPMEGWPVPRTTYSTRRREELSLS